MDLKTYFALKRGNQAAVAAETGIHASLLSVWASCKRPVPTPAAVPIERATGMVVRRWDLRPDDWHLIWPELIGVKGAPGVPDLRDVVNG